jgi:hypothetical protein
MEHRHLVAYSVLLLVVLALAALAFVASRNWRYDRRKSLRFQREQARRRRVARSDKA